MACKLLIFNVLQLLQYSGLSVTGCKLLFYLFFVTVLQWLQWIG